MDISSHAPGTFCWPELATTDQKAAVSFYRSLFGWDVNEQPIGNDEIYSMFQIRGKDVAAAFTMGAEMRQHGVPPHWGSYVAVANADQAVATATQLGATVLAPPFDVMESGRMAALQDPQGAAFSVWQAKAHIGAQILREPGALGWTELVTSDPQAAERFYTQLFGWSAKAGSAGTEPYTEFSVQGTPDAGMMKLNEQWGMPPYWMPYFEVADCDGSAKKAAELGGQTNLPPTDIPNVGRFALLADPQGAMFSIIKVQRHAV